MDADALTLRMELMHEAEKQGVVPHFLSLFFRTSSVLAWTFPQGLVAPSSHANRSRIFPWPELLPKN